MDQDVSRRGEIEAHVMLVGDIPYGNQADSAGDRFGNNCEAGGRFESEENRIEIPESEPALVAFKRMVEKKAGNKEVVLHVFSEVIQTPRTGWFRPSWSEHEFETYLYPQTRDSNRERILSIVGSSDEVKFNVTGGDFQAKKEFISLARAFGGQVYAIIADGGLIVVPGTLAAGARGGYGARAAPDEPGFFVPSVSYDDLDEAGSEAWRVPTDAVALLASDVPKVRGKNLTISDSTVGCEVVQLLHVKRILLVGGEDKHFFPKKVIEGMASFDASIVRLVLNDGEGIDMFLGLKARGSDETDASGRVEGMMGTFRSLLKAVMPGLDLVAVEGGKWAELQGFFSKMRHHGAVTGFPTIEVSNSILRELENGSGNNRWGMMTIGTAVPGTSSARVIQDMETAERVLQEESVDAKERNQADSIIAALAAPRRRERREGTAERLRKIVDYLREGGPSGLWDTSNYLFAEAQGTYDFLRVLFMAHYKSVNHFWLPLRVIPLDGVLSRFVGRFSHVDVETPFFTVSDEIHPFRTIYSSHRLADHVFFPSRSLSKLKVSRGPDFMACMPRDVLEAFKQPVQLGHLRGVTGAGSAFYIDACSLTRHCLVMGSTGSGKTNTIMRLLVGLQGDDRVPFLVIEPVKKEFRYLRSVVPDLEVYTAGEDANPLQVNMFEVPEFLTHEQWINELMDIFSCWFLLFSPFRERLFSCLNDLYTLNGWKDGIRGRTPTIEEFIPFAKLTLDCSDYSAKTRDEYKGVIETRFSTLLKGTRAKVFNAGESRPKPADLVKRRAVIELDGLHNDDERALVFNLILRKIYMQQQHAGFSPRLRHVLVIEEAHRLISAIENTNDDGVKSIKKKAQDVFSDILSEIRTYGEGIIISDQKPQQLNEVAVSNTNIKICHKLPSLNQVMSFKESLGLDADHLALISRLVPGECVTKIDEVNEPFLIKVDLIKDPGWGIDHAVDEGRLDGESKRLAVLDSLECTVSLDEGTGGGIVGVKQIEFRDGPSPTRIYDPTRPTFESFSNATALLWKSVKEAHAKHSRCDKCKTLLNGTKICPTCREPGKKLETLRIPLLGLTLPGKVVAANVQLDELIRSHEELSPSEYNTRAQADLQELKRKFKALLASKGEADLGRSGPGSRSQADNRDRKDNLASLFGSEKDETSTPKEKTLAPCAKCGNVNLAVESVSLELVRKSSIKLVFEIAHITVKCDRCHESETTTFMNKPYHADLPGFTDALKRSIHNHLLKNKYCKMCNEYYAGERCPTHGLLLTMPSLVFVRGVNLQFSSSTIINSERK
ncbi:MAG: ATP-binding protein [Candidatus Lokiarchaeota archaeon]|nr:ATP-binding protein [Candidatus Lokiarchaeota archaeon]